MNHQWVFKISKLFFIVVFSFLLTSCVILMLGGPSKLDEPQAAAPTYSHSKVQVYTMRGFMDVFSTGMDSLAQKIHSELHVKAKSLSYLEEKRLAKFLIDQYQVKSARKAIVLIGHSYGADDQITLAKRLNKANVPVELLITLDHTKTQTIPPNVRVFYNINSGYSAGTCIVPWGIPLSADSKHTKMVEINLVKDKHITRVNHFNIDKLPEVQTLIMNIIRKNIFKN